MRSKELDKDIKVKKTLSFFSINQTSYSSRQTGQFGQATN